MGPAAKGDGERNACIASVSVALERTCELPVMKQESLIANACAYAPPKVPRSIIPVVLLQKNARLFGLSRTGPEKPTTWLKPLMLFARLKVCFFKVPRSIADPLLKRAAWQIGEPAVDTASTAASPTTVPMVLIPKPRLMRPRVLWPMSSIGAGLLGL